MPSQRHFFRAQTISGTTTNYVPWYVEVTATMATNESAYAAAEATSAATALAALTAMMAIIFMTAVSDSTNTETTEVIPTRTTYEYCHLATHMSSAVSTAIVEI